jgi:hypothetical protein
MLLILSFRRVLYVICFLLGVSYIDYCDMSRLLCDHHQTALRHSQGTKVRTLWDPISFKTHIKITCRHSKYRNSSIIYVLLCFRR